MAKQKRGFKDHFSNTVAGFERDARQAGAPKKELTELPLAEQIKIADELVAKLKRENSKGRITEEKERYGNLELDAYRSNMALIAEKEKGKVKHK